MAHRWLIPVLLVAAIGWSGCSLVTQQSAAADARLVYRTLRQNEQAYQQALAAEKRTLRHVTKLTERQTTNPDEAQRVRAEIEKVQSQFDDLQAALRDLPVQPTLRKELLGAILRQLDQEKDTLARIGEQFGSPTESLPDPEGILNHAAPENLFTPAIQRMQREYRFAKPRRWRGHPLTV